MTIVINLGLCGGRIGGIFITGIFGNFYTKWEEFLTFKTGIPGGLAMNCVRTCMLTTPRSTGSVDRAPPTIYGIVLLFVSLLSPTGCVVFQSTST